VSPSWWMVLGVGCEVLSVGGVRVEDVKEKVVHVG